MTATHTRTCQGFERFPLSEWNSKDMKIERTGKYELMPMEDSFSSIQEMIDCYAESGKSFNGECIVDVDTIKGTADYYTPEQFETMVKETIWGAHAWAIHCSSNPAHFGRI